MPPIFHSELITCPDKGIFRGISKNVMWRGNRERRTRGHLGEIQQEIRLRSQVNRTGNAAMQPQMEPQWGSGPSGHTELGWVGADGQEMKVWLPISLTENGLTEDSGLARERSWGRIVPGLFLFQLNNQDTCRFQWEGPYWVANDSSSS